MEYAELKDHYWLEPERVMCGVEIHDPDWVKIVDRLIKRLDGLLMPYYKDDFRIDQIKEKFGGLRFYYTTTGNVPDVYTNQIDDWILIAELQVSNLMTQRRLDKAWRAWGEAKEAAKKYRDLYINVVDHPSHCVMNHELPWEKVPRRTEEGE